MKACATIIDVAKKAGVSPTTVTHTLNGKRPVSAQAKKAVLSAIEALGYVPSWNASHMKDSCSGIIGCLAADITEGFVNQIVKGIEKGLTGGSYSLLFVSGIEFGNNMKKAYDFLRSHRVDGMLFCHHIPLWEHNIDIGSISIPVVSINQDNPGITSIIPDNVLGGYQAAEHLLSCGARHPVFIGGPEKRISSSARFEGFSRKLRSVGLDPGYENSGEFSFAHGYETARALLMQDPAIDAIFGANDYISCGAQKALSDMEIPVPSKVKIVGFDDRDFSSFWPVPITTFRQPLEEMGVLGITLLRNEIEAKSIDRSTHKLSSQLIVRESTSCSI
jgi:DNA-binding LacI/PurR family transcriptional regulator